MKKCTITLMALTAAAAASAVSAQSRVDRAFEATGTSCEQVTWSKEAIAKYPNIEKACKEVMQRDGKFFVKFEGEVERVSDRGQQVTVDFEGGDRLTLTPPQNLTVYMDGRQTTVSNLRPGDQLNFYVPQDQLTATFFQGDVKTAAAQQVPIAPAPATRVAQAPPEAEQEQDTGATTEAELPRTAGPLPWIGLAGVLLSALGASLTLRRRMRAM
jgi:hypothetical protein